MDSWADRYLKCNYCQFGSEPHGCEIKAHRQHMPPMTTCQIRAETTAESERDRPVGKYYFAFEAFLVYCVLLGYCPLVPTRRQFWRESTRQKIHVAHRAPPSPGAAVVQLQWPLFTPAAPLTSLAFLSACSYHILFRNWVGWKVNITGGLGILFFCWKWTNVARCC